MRILESSRGGDLRILESSTGACPYGTSRISAPPSVEDNAYLDAAADRAPALPRRLMTMYEMVFHPRTRRLVAAGAQYRMFETAEDFRAPLAVILLLLYVTDDLLRYEVAASRRSGSAVF